MLVTIEIDPARRTAAFREVSYLAAGDSCRVVLDGVRGADFGTLRLALYRDAASESPVASCASFSPVGGHPALADGLLALDTFEMSAWFAAAAPVPEESDSDSDPAAPAVSRNEPRLAARASLAERSVRAEGWLVASDSDRVWAACRAPVLLRPGAGTSGASDPSSVRALVSELVAGLVSAALADKADKAPPSAAGNLASLDSSGNLADSGATPESIKAAAVAEVVANAPAALDTLEEIADLLGSPQQSGTVLKRISDLETGKADSSSLARVATSGSYDDLSDKPTIPAAVTVDATLTTQGAAADAKAVGDALRGGFTEWEFSDGEAHTISALTLGSDDNWHYFLDETYYSTNPFVSEEEAISAVLLTFENTSVIATRHLVTPTKTSQLTNDGDGTNAFVKTNDTRLSDARTPTAHHATHAAGGSDPLSPADIGAASMSDLPYRLVEPGEWEFSDGQSHEISGPNEVFGPDEASVGWVYQSSYNGVTYYSQSYETKSLALATLEITFSRGGDSFTATRPSLPGHLCDRAGNRVVVTGDTVLTLPAAVPGYLRDFLVRLEISGSTVPTITFQGQGSEAPNGADEITYETDGDEFPVPDEAGTWSYSFTEDCVAHKFAVSLKKVNEVAAPQAQGGS